MQTNARRFEQTYPRDGLWNLVGHDEAERNKSVAQLIYRHRETDEEIQVPNIWYNQPVETRIEAMRFYAEQSDRTADRKEKENSPWSARDAAGFRQQAKRLRDVAAEMARTGKVLA